MLINTTEGVITLPSGKTLPDNLPKIVDLRLFLSALSHELSDHNFYVGMNAYSSPYAWTILLYSKNDPNLCWEVRLSDGLTVTRFTREPYRSVYLAYKPRCSVKVWRIVRRWMSGISGDEILIGLYARN